MLSPRAKQLTCALAIPILPGTNPRTEGHNCSSHLHSIITQLSYMVPTEFSSADEWAAKSSCTCHKKLRKWYTQQEELKPHSQWNETGIKAKYCMMQLIWGALYRQVIRSWWKTWGVTMRGVQLVWDDDKVLLMRHKAVTILNATVFNFSNTAKGSGEMAWD